MKMMSYIFQSLLLQLWGGVSSSNQLFVQKRLNEKQQHNLFLFTTEKKSLKTNCLLRAILHLRLKFRITSIINMTKTWGPRTLWHSQHLTRRLTFAMEGISSLRMARIMRTIPPQQHLLLPHAMNKPSLLWTGNLHP